MCSDDMRKTSQISSFCIKKCFGDFPFSRVTFCLKMWGFAHFYPLDTSDLFQSFLKSLRSLWGLISSLELEERYTTVLFMGWPGVMKTGFEIKPNGSSENCGFVSEDKLPRLFLSFFFLKALPFFLLPAAGFTIVTRHQSDVMVPPESQSLPPVNVWTAASSPSSLCYRPPDITERHLSRACRGKYLTLLMFRDITSPSRSAYQRILILPDEFKLPTKYLFKAHLVSLCVLGFIRIAQEFFFSS